MYFVMTRAENGTKGDQETRGHRPVRFKRHPKVPLYLNVQSYKEKFTQLTE